MLSKKNADWQAIARKSASMPVGPQGFEPWARQPAMDRKTTGAGTVAATR